MKDLTTFLTLTIPLLIAVYCLYDLVAWCSGGAECTITGIVRGWASRSTWPEFLYGVGVIVLYLHLFRGWPGE